MYPGYDRWPYPGPICRTNDPCRSGNPASLLLHNISNKLGRHIYAYAGTPQQVSRLYRHIRTLAGIHLYAGLADALIFRPGLYFVNRHIVNHSPGIFLASGPYLGSSPRHGEEVEDFCERSFSHTHPLLCYCFALLYLFYLHRFIKNPKKLESLVVVISLL
jgi:hypothetical protein